MAFAVRWETPCVEVRYSGDCTDQEVLQAVIQVQADERFDSTHQALHDFRGCRSFSYSVSHLEELAARNIGAARSNPRLWIAVVTDLQEVLAMLQCFDDLGPNPYPIRSFTNIESARAWLNAASADGWVGAR